MPLNTPVHHPSKCKDENGDDFTNTLLNAWTVVNPEDTWEDLAQLVSSFQSLSTSTSVVTSTSTSSVSSTVSHNVLIDQKSPLLEFCIHPQLGMAVNPQTTNFQDTQLSKIDTEPPSVPSPSSILPSSTTRRISRKASKLLSKSSQTKDSHKETEGKPITIIQNRSDLGQLGVTGTVVWDSAVVCSRLLASIHHNDLLPFGIPLSTSSLSSLTHFKGLLDLRDCTVLELGTGTGLVSITISKLVGVRGLVVATDQLKTLESVTERNVELNNLGGNPPKNNDVKGQSGNSSGRRSIGKKGSTSHINSMINHGDFRTPAGSGCAAEILLAELMWDSNPMTLKPQLNQLFALLGSHSDKIHAGDADNRTADLITSTSRAFDVIVCSDCVYNDSIVPALVETIYQICRDSDIRKGIQHTSKENGEGNQNRGPQNIHTNSTRVIVAQEIRSEAVHALFLEQLVDKGFEVWRVPRSWTLHDPYQAFNFSDGGDESDRRVGEGRSFYDTEHGKREHAVVMYVGWLKFLT
jgi:predicted nicotinamide N-methyase